MRAGAQARRAAKKAQLASINQRLATLYTTFSQNVLADEESYVALLDKEADLAGLPESRARRRGRRGRRSAGKPGKWAITNTRSSVGAVPDLLDAARPAREGVAERSSTAATTATRTTTTRSSPRS